MKYFSNVLILAPHTDDGELGCGGTISKLIEDGTNVFYVAFSPAEQSSVPGIPANKLRAELKKALKILSISESNIIALNFEIRTFSYHRQEILDNMINLAKDIKPDLVLVPSLNDIHQDHHVIAEEGVRAFKTTTILSYEEPWNNISFSTQVFISLKESDIQKKIAALSCYETQKNRVYLNQDFIKGLARTRGVQIGVNYAEAFEVIRWVVN